MKPLLRDEPSLLVGGIITFALIVFACVMTYTTYLDFKNAPQKKPKSAVVTKEQCGNKPLTPCENTK